MLAERERIAQLDGVRGVAILLVLTFHLTYFGPLPTLVKRAPHLHPLLVAMMSGWSGVDLFFVLSGFLITRILLRSKGAPGYFRSFYVRRVLRIFPAYYFALAVYFVLPLPDSFKLERIPLDDAAWLAAYVSNLRIASEGWDSIAISLQHFWSLAIEEQFYLAWPLLIWALNRERALWMCAAMLLLSLALRVVLVSHHQPVAAYVLTPARLDGFAAGALLALLAERGQLPSRSVRLGLYVVGGLGVAWVIARTGWFAFEEPFWGPSIGISLASLLGFALLSSALAAPRTSLVSRALQSRLLAFIGRYSYGLYVWHQPVIITMRRQHWVRTLASTGISPESVVFLWYASGIFFALALALLSYYLVERTFLLLKDRLAPTPRIVTP